MRDQLVGSLSFDIDRDVVWLEDGNRWMDRDAVEFRRR
ncbi:hypothetical protein A2U01_0085153, partial [Trifolium medium]|nr:hypothetical protein [Trifolium medium]